MWTTLWHSSAHGPSLLWILQWLPSTDFINSMLFCNSSGFLEEEAYFRPSRMWTN